MKRALILLIATFMLASAPVLTAAPAQAAWQTCIGQPVAPTSIAGGKIARGGVLCVGWGIQHRLQTRVTLEQRYGIEGVALRWITAPYWFGTEGEKRGSYATRTYYDRSGGTVGVRLRTCVQSRVIASTGLVLKRYGKTCSPAVSFR